MEIKMRYKLIVPLEFLGLMFILAGFLDKLFNIYILAYNGDLLMIQGLMIEILAFIIYYGEKKYNSEVHK
jgi:hypothetical protein